MNRRALLGFGLFLAIAAVGGDAVMPARAADLQAEAMQPLVNPQSELQSSWQIDQQIGWRRGPRPRWGGSQ